MVYTSHKKMVSVIGDENPLCFILDVKKPPLDPFRSFSQWETWKPINSIDERDLPMTDRDFIWSDQSMVVMFNHTISYFQAFFNEFFDHCTSQSCSCSGIQLTSLLGSDLQRHACCKSAGSCVQPKGPCGQQGCSKPCYCTSGVLGVIIVIMFWDV